MIEITTTQNGSGSPVTVTKELAVTLLQFMGVVGGLVLITVAVQAILGVDVTGLPLIGAVSIFAVYFTVDYGMRVIPSELDRYKTE